MKINLTKIVYDHHLQEVPNGNGRALTLGEAVSNALAGSPDNAEKTIEQKAKEAKLAFAIMAAMRDDTANAFEATVDDVALIKDVVGKYAHKLVLYNFLLEIGEV